MRQDHPDDIENESTPTSGSGTRANDSGDSRLERFARSLLRVDDLVERLMRHLRFEAFDYRSPAWPPTWLKAVAGISSVFLALGLLVPFGGLVGAVFAALGFEALGRMQASSALQFLLATVSDFLARSSAGLPLSPDEIFVAWKVSGVGLFLASVVGSRGGRVGWALYGLLTSAIVWAQVPTSSRWVAAGVVLVAWSILSILALGRSAGPGSPRSPRRPGSQRGRTRSETLTARAERSAQKHAYADLSAYFDQQGSESIDRIAQALRIPKSRVSELRSDYLPVWVSSRVRMTPAKQKRVIAEYREGEASRKEICENNEISLSEFRGLLKRYEAAEHASD